MLEHQEGAKSAGTCSLQQSFFLRIPSSAVIQLFRYSEWEKNHFITQADIFLQENARLADISSAGEAVLICLYTGAVGDTLEQLRLQRFQQNVSTSMPTRFVHPENLPPTAESSRGVAHCAVPVAKRVGLFHWLWRVSMYLC